LSENAIEVESVCKTFQTIDKNTIFHHLFGQQKNGTNSNGSNELNENLVLKDISFKVKKGEMFGILGRNGIGKTTLLRLIAGIYKPDSGMIRVKGSLIPLLSIGTGFNVELSARDNIILYGKILGFSHDGIKEKVHEILNFAELEKFSDVILRKFSTGMAMRLAFSTAIQIDPDIILVDEILAVGDLAFQKKSYNAFMSFRERKKTIVYVSQDINSINKLCDRAMLLNDAKIESIGAPSKVVNDYLSIVYNQQ